MKPSAFFLVAALLSAVSLFAVVVATAPSYAQEAQYADTRIAEGIS